MGDTDILSIHNAILKEFEEEEEHMNTYRTRLSKLESMLQTLSLRNRMRHVIQDAHDALSECIAKISSRETYCYYTMETSSILEEYKSLLQVPLKMSFTGPPLRKDTQRNQRRKAILVSKYIGIVSKYSTRVQTSPVQEKAIRCTNCPNRSDFEIVDTHFYICTQCYSQQTVLRHVTSYSDVDRVNISNTYTYERKVHFAECINQYQGKQNSTIPQCVYDDLEDQFDRHHMLYGDKDTPMHVRFADVTKTHILMFLKDLKYPNHYENVNLIHYVLTGKKPDDISHLEDQLLDDFDTLNTLYNKRYHNRIKRKNFINTQYVLYQLLRNHKHPCDKDEFIVLKTIDRKHFHDDTCRSLFEELGWNHTPFF